MVANGNDSTARGTGALLREVARLHVRAQREQAACCGSTAAACQILTEIGRSGPQPGSSLGRRLGLHKGWISRAVSALSEDGLVRCTRSRGDARVVTVALTPAGRGRVKRLERGLAGQAARILGRLSPADRAQVHRALHLVRDALRQELGLAGGPGQERRGMVPRGRCP